MSGTPLSLNDYLLTVGKLIHNGALTEGYLFGAFRILSGCDAKMAGAIFYSLDALRAKKNLLKRVVKSSGDTKDEELVREIIAAAEKSNNQRQHVSHALLSHVVLSPDELRLLRPKVGKKVPITKEYMGDLMKKSGEAYNEGQAAFHKLCQKHGVCQKLWHA